MPDIVDHSSVFSHLSDRNLTVHRGFTGVSERKQRYKPGYIPEKQEKLSKNPGKYPRVRSKGEINVSNVLLEVLSRLLTVLSRMCGA